MRYLLWVKLPESAYDKKDEIDKFFREEFKDELELRVMVTYGECEITLFGKPLFTYPYWLLKLKMWLSR